MSWVKHSDKQWSDPAFQNLSDGAQALWYRADSYVADHLLDGRLPATALKMLATRARYVRELVDQGHWVLLESGEYSLTAWRERIQSKAQVVARRSETLQRVRAYRNAVTNATRNADPGPVPDLISSSEEELNSPARISSSTHTSVSAREQSFRRPLGEAPPELKPPQPTRSPWLQVWVLYERSLKSEGLLGHPVAHKPALAAIAAAATAESMVAEGEAFDRAVQRLLGAWQSDAWVAQHTPPISNLANNLAKYRKGAVAAAAKPAQPPSQIAYQRMREAQRRWARADEFDDKSALMAEWNAATDEVKRLREQEGAVAS